MIFQIFPGSFPTFFPLSHGLFGRFGHGLRVAGVASEGCAALRASGR